MILSLRRYIYSNWKKFPSLQKAPENVDFLGVAGSLGGGTTTFLLFADSMKFPFGVVRSVRHPVWKEDLEREWGMLGMLKNTSLCASVPFPLFYEVFAGVPTLGESVLQGVPMQVRSGSDGVPIIPLARSHFRSVLDWIIALHKETEAPLGKETGASLEKGAQSSTQTSLSALVSQGQIVKIIERCTEICSLNHQERGLLSEIIGVDTLLPHLQRSFIVHGDFVPHNILLSGNSLRVIDWISAKRSPLGCFDIFSFSLVYALHARKMGGLHGYIKAFSGAFLNNNNFSNIIEACLREYSASLGIEVSRMRSLFAFFLVIKAEEEYDRRLSLVPYGFIPRWSKNIANSTKLTYRQALKESIWIYFIKLLLRRKASFIIQAKDK